MKDLNVILGGLQLLEENKGKSFEDTGSRFVQMRLYHSKGDDYQNQETTLRMGESLCQLLIGIYKELQKLNTIRTNNLINKCTNV
jgi:hypothetical protein